MSDDDFVELNLGNIPPSVLLSHRDNQFTWSMVLGELCDNSFDASATRIDIEFASKQLMITDDGNGCDNIEKMLTIGQHYKHSGTKLGRFGVGLKDAACWLWGTLQVRTTCGGIFRTAAIDWDTLSRSDTWRFRGPKPLDAAGPSGTQLLFRNVTKKLPDVDRIKDDLGYTFAPAIMASRQIRISRPRKPPVLVQAWRMPDVIQQINDRFEINGKRVHLVAGIVPPEHTNERSGFNICHAHRMICNTSFGSGEYSTSRICGVITLDNDWTLSRNKTELVDRDSDALYGMIYQACEGILKESAVQAAFLRNTALESSVTNKLRAMLGSGLKEKRAAAHNNTGAVTPKHTGRKRTPKNVRSGDGVASRLAGRVRMEWRPRPDKLMGEVDLPGAVIYLNSEHPRLQQHLLAGNEEAIADACVTLIVFEEMQREEKSKLFKDFSGFVEALSGVMTQQEAQQKQQDAITC